MPAKFEGLLDQGRLEDVNLNTVPWKPSRSVKWNFDFIRPEFIALRPGLTSSPKKTLRPTAWLDGLRGFAALLVFVHHNQLWAHGIRGNYIFETAFGYEGNHYFAQLPFIRILFSGGHFAVAIFFVISGYVLSLKPLSLIQKNQSPSALENIGSALFRRWLRLYLPIIAVTFTWLCFRHMTHVYVNIHKLEPSFGADVLNWYRSFKNYSFVFSENIYTFTTAYHAHTWSIPIEFKGSIVVYTALSALSRCTRNARLMCEAGLIFYFLYVVDGYYGSLFITGMMLCDLELLAQADQLPHFFSILASFKEFVFFHLLLIALYLGGVPSYDQEGMDRITLLRKTPGWKWLSHLKPQAVFDAKWFYLYWAAFFTVAAVPRLPILKRCFETRFCQYLARISFALYLVHGPVIWLLSDRLYAATGLIEQSQKEHLPGWCNKLPLSTKGPMGLELAFWAPQLIIWPVTFYAAEMITKAIDEPSVKFANWLYKQTLAPPASPKR